MQIARTEISRPRPDLAFLAGMQPYPCLLTGTVAGLDVTVRVRYDPDYRLGDDDVTGWFTDRYERGCIPTPPHIAGGRATAHGPIHGPIHGHGASWYRPSNYTLAHTFTELRQAGMSRAMATDTYRAILAEELHQDAWRYWLGVTATVSYDGEHLGEASLWGIDHTLHPNHQLDDVASLIEVATDLIDEALHDAHETAAAIAVRLRERAENLTRLLNPPPAHPAI